MTHPSVNSIVERLEPCPFCGSKRLTCHLNAVICDECSASGPDIGEVRSRPLGVPAIEAWNTRPSATIISELQAALYLEKNKSANLEQNYHELETRLQAENRRLQRALMFWMPGVDLRLDEATREQCANDAGLLAGYSGPLAGRRWGNEIIDTVAGLQAERVDKAAAWDALAEKNAKIAALESSLSRIKEETIEVRRPDGKIDEVIAKSCDLHIEQLSDSGWFISITAGNGDYAAFHFGATRGRAHVSMIQTDSVPAIRSLGSTGGAEKTAEGGHSDSSVNSRTE